MTAEHKGLQSKFIKDLTDHVLPLTLVDCGLNTYPQPLIIYNRGKDPFRVFLSIIPNAGDAQLALVFDPQQNLWHTGVVHGKPFHLRKPIEIAPFYEELRGIRDNETTVSPDNLDTAIQAIILEAQSSPTSALE